MLMIEYFPNFMTSGVFSLFTVNDGLKWVTAETDLHSFDLEYFANHSGLKRIAPLLEVLQDKEHKEQAIKSILLARYKDKWNRSYQALIESVYNPIHNYDRTETHEENINVTGGNDGSNKTTVTGKTGVTSTGNLKNNTFNQGMTPISESSDTNDATSTSDTTSTVKNENHENTGRSLTITAQGNIGMTTTQQMITDEIIMRDTYNFVDMLYKDIDKVLCLGIY